MNPLIYVGIILLVFTTIFIIAFWNSPVMEVLLKVITCLVCNIYLEFIFVFNQNMPMAQ